MNEDLMNFLMNYFMEDEIDRDVKIFEMGYVDSLFFMQLVSFLENEMNVRFETADMNMENFSTVNKIIHWVEEKQQPPK